MMKVGIIRCQQTEDMCSGNTDFKVASEGKLAFEETGPVEVMGFVIASFFLFAPTLRNSILVA